MQFTIGGLFLSMAQITHWHILGTGSLGGLWAYYLAKAGHKITLIAKDKEQQQAFENIGAIRLVSPDSEALKISVVHETECQLQKIENLLITLKAYQTEDALNSIKKHVAYNATVILMQNGMGNHDHLKDALHDRNLYASVTTEAALKHSPLCVQHTGTGNTYFGLISGTADINLLDKLDCLLQTELTDKIDTMLWRKLVINCCINPLTVIHQCKNGELSNTVDALQTIDEIINECRILAIKLGKDHYLENIKQDVMNVISATAANTSSMLQDVQNKQKTEIDYMNGYIANEARKINLITPSNTLIYHLVNSIYG